MLAVDEGVDEAVQMTRPRLDGPRVDGSRVVPNTTICSPSDSRSNSVRKSIARVLTVINQKQRENLRSYYKGKNCEWACSSHPRTKPS
jgi:hypothetical protein